MEFNEKLQELRRNRGVTQEELANSLYVSRTAVSKWESGRGYPNIDSLKAIAAYFSVTVDQLISTDEVIAIAEEDHRQKTNCFRDLCWGFLDIAMAMLLFLPFFGSGVEGETQSLTLLALRGVQPYLKASYFSCVVAQILVGILTLAMQSVSLVWWHKAKRWISLSVGALGVMLFMISAQPYASVFAFILLICKICTLLKRA